MSNKEIEQRFIDIDTKKFREKLKEVGAKLISKNIIMPLIVFSHPKNKKDSYIRIRDEGKQVTLTSKTNLKNKYVTEYEVEINSFEEGVKVLYSLGCKKRYLVEKTRETWILPGCKEIVIDSYPGLKEYVEVDCHDEKSLQNAINKLGLKVPSDDTDLSINKMYYDQYGIPINRKSNGDLTFENGLKIFNKLIKKNKSKFVSILKAQQKLYKK
jgi:predicted adenylyl cyclase CyaB